MIFKPNIERWRDLVSEQADRIPVDVILALIRHESKGIAGKISGLQTRSKYKTSEMDCGLDPELRGRALGLMQIAPICLRHYNLMHKSDPVTPCQLADKSIAGVRQQLKVGVWFFGLCLKWAHGLNPIKNPWPRKAPSKNQIQLATLAYAQGIAGAQKRILAAKTAGLPLTAESIEQIDPGWGAPEKPFRYARLIASFYDPHPTRPGAKKKSAN